MRRASASMMVVLLACFVISFAHAADPVPEFYGFYALDNGRLIELKESSSNWPNVSAAIHFVEFGKGVGTAPDNTHLSRLAFHRATIDPDSATPVRMENRWFRPSNASRAIELRAKPIAGQPEMIMLVPREALRSGVYSVVRHDSVIATFFVNKDAVLANLEASDECIDHVWEAMGDEFDWDKFDKRVKGKPQAIHCSQSKLDGLERQSTAGRESAFQNCLSAGYDQQFCDKQYRQAGAKSGTTETATKSGAIGLWTGKVKFGLASSDARVQINALDKGKKVGTTRYTKIGESTPYCEGELVLSDDSDGQYVFQETITRTRGLECAGGGTLRITLPDGASVNAAWDNRYKPGKPGYQGSLKRK